MNLKKYNKDIISKKLEIANDNDENVIYERGQSGPQEEESIFEFYLDLDAWSNYLKQKDKEEN